MRNPVLVTVKGRGEGVIVPSTRMPFSVEPRQPSPAPAAVDHEALRKREAARLKAKERASSSIRPPCRPPRKSREAWVHLADRKALLLLPDVVVTCKCTKPQLLEQQNYLVCVTDDCLGAWVRTQGYRTRHGAAAVKTLYSQGMAIWLDFLQSVRCAMWERAVVKDRILMGYELAGVAIKYLQYLEQQTKCRDLYQHDPEDDAEPESQTLPSIEELLNAEVSELVDDVGPFQYTLLREVIAFAPPPPDGDAFLLHMAGQLEIQDVALLLDQPIAATVCRADKVLREMQERTWP